MSEILEVVDENNNVIGIEDRKVVLEKGLYHRMSHVVVINSDGKILLQRRSSSKSVWPLHWDIIVAEHLKPGESYEEGAARGLREELNIQGTLLTKLDGPRLRKAEYGKLKEYEFRVVYKTEYDGEIIPDRSEVEEVGFFTAAQAEQLAGRDKVTPWFLSALSWLRENVSEFQK